MSNRRTKEKFTAALVPCGSVGCHCFAWHSRDARCWPRVRARLQANDRSEPGRSCRRRPAHRQPSRYRQRRPGHQPALFSLAGGWCKRTCKPSTGNVKRMHRRGKAKRSTKKRTVNLMSAKRLSSFHPKMLEGPAWEALWPFCAPSTFFSCA